MPARTKEQNRANVARFRKRERAYRDMVRARAAELKDIVAFYQKRQPNGVMRMHYDLPAMDHRTLQDECERRGWDFNMTMHDVFREILRLDTIERKAAARAAKRG